MNNYTPNDWIAIMTAAGVLITAVGSAITGILAVLLGRKVSRTERKVEASARVSDQNATDIQTVKHQTNDITSQLASAKLAQGTAEGHAAGMIEGAAAEKANPS